MKKLTLTLETITPLFLAGAEPEEGGELRPASFRGQMRYWLRAMLGAGHGIDQVRQVESRLFGTADQEFGAAQFSMSLRGDVSFEQTFRTLGSRAKPLGYDYLYYSMRGMGEGKKDRHYAQPGQKFDLILRERPASQCSDKNYDLAVASLWLEITLGGIGARSRRTGGSLAIRDVNGNTNSDLPLVSHAEKSSELTSEIQSGLRQIATLCPRIQLSGKLSNYDVLHPTVCGVWVVSEKEPGWQDWREAVESIGATMRAFRLRRPPDYATAQAILARRAQNPEIQRAAFGLPLQIRFSSQSGSVFVGNSERPDQPKIRRASPLHLKVARLATGRYVGVAVLFKSVFLPPETPLLANRTEIPKPKDYSLIEEFIERFPVHPEVTGW